MEILEAYCEDLRRTVEIYEAQEEFFDQPAGHRHRFRFRCSDAACRATNNPLVVGVNYDKNAEDTDKYQQPHFKSHTKHPHIDTCVWMRGNAGGREEEPRGDERDVFHPDPKATNVVDVFEPRHSDTLPATTAANARSPAVDSGDVVQDGAGEASDRTGITSTSRLEKLIDCWSRMEPEARRRHRVAINGRSLTYHQLCIRVDNLSEGEDGARVAYGGARVRSWPAASPTHYFVNFIDECDRYPEVAGHKSLTISLPIKRLRQSRRGALLMDRIEQASQPDYYLKVYAWGNITARAGGKKGYELELAALDNVVLKVIKKNSAARK